MTRESFRTLIVSFLGWGLLSYLFLLAADEFLGGFIRSFYPFTLHLSFLCSATLLLLFLSPVPAVQRS